LYHSVQPGILTSPVQGIPHAQIGWPLKAMAS
jgi:hypothetical protein